MLRIQLSGQGFCPWGLGWSSWRLRDQCSWLSHQLPNCRIWLPSFTIEMWVRGLNCTLDYSWLTFTFDLQQGQRWLSPADWSQDRDHGSYSSIWWYQFGPSGSWRRFLQFVWFSDSIVRWVRQFCRLKFVSPYRERKFLSFERSILVPILREHRYFGKLCFVVCV